MKKLLSSIALVLLFCACSNPQEGYDKTLGGAVLGAGWGAGAGAVIGHQVSYAGEGVAVGAGFGAVGGALTGLGYDMNEDALITQEKELAALKLQSDVNMRRLSNLQSNLDGKAAIAMGTGVQQIFFDLDATSLRTGALANLEVFAEQVKASPYARTIHVVGHSDDSGSPEYNSRLAEARARAVSSYLAGRGIALGQIKVSSHGSQRPVAANTSDTGRQLNRRVDVYVE